MQVNIKKSALRRLKIIEGQVRGLHKMVVQEKYCLDIISQTLAVKQALSSVEDLLFKNHLLTHVSHQFKNGQHTRAAGEILAVFKLAKKK